MTPLCFDCAREIARGGFPPSEIADIPALDPQGVCPVCGGTAVDSEDIEG